MLRDGYEPRMGLGRNRDNTANLVEFTEIRGRFRLGYKPSMSTRGGSPWKERTKAWPIYKVEDYKWKGFLFVTSVRALPMWDGCTKIRLW